MSLGINCPHCSGLCVVDITKDDVIAWAKENSGDFHEIVLQFQLGASAGELVAKGYSLDEVRRTLETALSAMPAGGIVDSRIKRN